MDDLFSFDFEIVCFSVFRQRSDERDDYVTEFQLDLMKDIDEEGEIEPVLAGRIEGCKVRCLQAIADMVPLDDVFDCHSDELLEVYQAVFASEAGDDGGQIK